MIYLDYAANYPTNEEVLKTFIDATKKYIANPNSVHSLGRKAKEQINLATQKIANYFKSNPESVIYTSGSTESNNLVIKGIAEENKNLGKHIIISSIEHSSVIAPCNFLSSLGYEISVIPITQNGYIDLEVLEKEIRNDTILVSICTVDSELGTIQPISEISKIVKKYPNCSFHTDATQAIGKMKIDFEGVDFITFSPHKFGGLNGCGVLLNVNNKKIVPLIHGGKSNNIYRSGTPSIANILALDKSLELAVINLSEKYDYVKKLNQFLRKEIAFNKRVNINSPENSIPHILNISLVNFSNKEMIDELEKKKIFLSTTTACSLENAPSKSVFAITGNEKLALNSLRISISDLTTEKEVKSFVNEFNKIL